MASRFPVRTIKTLARWPLQLTSFATFTDSCCGPAAVMFVILRLGFITHRPEKQEVITVQTSTRRQWLPGSPSLIEEEVYRQILARPELHDIIYTPCPKTNTRTGSWVIRAFWDSLRRDPLPQERHRRLRQLNCWILRVQNPFIIWRTSSSSQPSITVRLENASRPKQIGNYPAR